MCSHALALRWQSCQYAAHNPLMRDCASHLSSDFTHVPHAKQLPKHGKCYRVHIMIMSAESKGSYIQLLELMQS